MIDVNSAAPQTKIECAALVAAAGGRYVEAAVMTSVPPHGIRVPMLLGGAHAAQAEKLLRELGLRGGDRVRRPRRRIGDQAVPQRHHQGSGIAGGGELHAPRARSAWSKQVLASLKETYPQFDWEKQGDYLFSRVIQHGKRRAEEMRASAQMIDATGVGGIMAAGRRASAGERGRGSAPPATSTTPRHSNPGANAPMKC